MVKALRCESCMGIEGVVEGGGGGGGGRRKTHPTSSSGQRLDA